MATKQPKKNATKKNATKQPKPRKPGANKASRAPVRKRWAGPLDVEAVLASIDAWCRHQRALQVRLLRFPAMSDREIDAVPSLLATFPFELPTPYDPSRFVLPRGYRELLRRAGGLRVEFREDDAQPWQTWPVVNIFRPADCSRTHCGATNTLADSWTAAGATLDERAFSTTEFISFAGAGFDAEASRWCFYCGEAAGAPPSIYLEDNDYECLLGKYVDTGEWVSELHEPVFASFEQWLSTLGTVVCARRFDPEANDRTVNAIIERGTKLELG